MYYFKNLNMDFMGTSGAYGACGAGFEGCDKKHAKKCAKGEFLEIVKIGAKFRRQLFDDYSFCLGAKSRLEADFECALRMIEVIREAGDMFFVVRKVFAENSGAKGDIARNKRNSRKREKEEKQHFEKGKTGDIGRQKEEFEKSKKDEIAGFWYFYDVNCARKFDEASGKMVKTPVVGTIAGCLKKEFWGSCAREIMHEILKKAFFELGFQKIKCETFSTNPYVEGFLKEFNFKCEGVLVRETMASGRAADVKIWGLLKDEYEV